VVNHRMTRALCDRASRRPPMPHMIMPHRSIIVRIADPIKPPMTPMMTDAVSCPVTAPHNTNVYKEVQ